MISVSYSSAILKLPGFSSLFLFTFGCIGSSLHAWASHRSGFSCCRARALGAWASVVVARGLSSSGARALEHRLSSYGAQA